MTIVISLHARYPTGPIVLGHFNGAQIDLLLDDYIRNNEKEIAKLWQEEIAAAINLFCVHKRNLEKDACLISIKQRKKN